MVKRKEYFYYPPIWETRLP